MVIPDGPDAPEIEVKHTWYSFLSWFMASKELYLVNY